MHDRVRETPAGVSQSGPSLFQSAAASTASPRPTSLSKVLHPAPGHTLLQKPSAPSLLAVTRPHHHAEQEQQQEQEPLLVWAKLPPHVAIPLPHTQLSAYPQSCSTLPLASSGQTLVPCLTAFLLLLLLLLMMLPPLLLPCNLFESLLFVILLK